MHKENSVMNLGFRDLDNIASGIEGGDLVIIGGRASMGKSAFLLNITRNLAVVGKTSVLFFSSGNSKEELVQKLLSLHAKIEKDKIDSGCIKSSEWVGFVQSAGEISEASIFVEKAKGLDDLMAKARDAKGNIGIEVIIIDDLHLMCEETSGKMAPKKISEIAVSLKELAKSLQIPIIATSRILLKTELNDSNRPFLRDLGGEPPIELSADKVFLIFRELDNKLHAEDKHYNEVIVAKNRIGPVGSVKLRFFKSYMGLEDFS